MLAAGVGEKIRGPGSALDRLDVARVLGVEDAQRIVFQTTLRLIAQPRSGRGEERDQSIAIALLRFRIAQAVEAQRQVFQSRAAVKVHLEQDALDVLLRLGDTEGLDAELMVLTEPA